MSSTPSADPTGVATSAPGCGPTPVPSQESTPVSPHVTLGHAGRYRDCELEDCLTYRRRYRKRWQYERAHGRKRSTDSAAAASHVQTLLGAGWSARAIAGAAATSPNVVTRLRDGKQGSVTVKVAQRLLAIDAASVPSTPSKQTTEPFVPRVGTTRRIQALLFMGWGHAELYRRSGIRTEMALHQKGRWVTRTTHDRVAAVYSELCMLPGPSSKARTWARKLGYVGPFGWDDIDQDAAPVDQVLEDLDVDEVAIQRRMGGDKSVRLTKAEAAELVRRWRASDRTLVDCERITGVNPDRHKTSASASAPDAPGEAPVEPTHAIAEHRPGEAVACAVSPGPPDPTTQEAC